LRLTATHKPRGFDLCFLYLRNIKGFGWNHKRVYRFYLELALNLRTKPKRRIKREKPEALTPSFSNWWDTAQTITANGITSTFNFGYKWGYYKMAVIKKVASRDIAICLARSSME